MKALYLLIGMAIFCLPIHAIGKVTDCPEECLNVGGRPETEECAVRVLRAAEEELDRYLKEVKANWSNLPFPAVIKAIDVAQRRWLDFREAACGALSETWTNGTGRSIATYACEIDLTRRWTHMIWEYFSPGVKGGKGGLPEPKTSGE
jgi:uncharacterized protein YecT (DUF1311 family)